MSKPHAISKGMGHAARAASKSRKDPIPFTETPPLTAQEYRAIRLKEEQDSRDEIKRLRAGWETHQDKVRMAGVNNKPT